MSSVNQVNLVGYVGADVDIKTMSNGGRVGRFSIATSERWLDKETGEPREKTDWHKVVIFSEPLIKIAERIVKRGCRVYVSGKLETRKYFDVATGTDRWITEVLLKGFQCVLNLMDNPFGDQLGEQQLPSGGAQRVPSGNRSVVPSNSTSNVKNVHPDGKNIHPDVRKEYYEVDKGQRVIPSSDTSSGSWSGDDDLNDDIPF